MGSTSGRRLDVVAGKDERSCMADDQSSEGGTLVTAALLLLALGFVGYWIYTTAGNEPQVLAPWFLVAGVGLVVLAIVFNVLRARRGPSRP
jgi:hypothetical protein